MQFKSRYDEGPECDRKKQALVESADMKVKIVRYNCYLVVIYFISHVNRLSS